LSVLAAIPAVREAIPDWYERILPGGLDASNNISKTLLITLSMTGQHQDELARYLSRQNDPEDLKLVAKMIQDSGVSVGGELLRYAQEIALNRDLDRSMRYKGWQVALRASGDDLQQVYDSLKSQYINEPDFVVRSSMIEPLERAGPSANPLLLSLMNSEVEPTALIELTGVYLNVPGNLNNQKSIDAFRPYVGRVLAALGFENGKVDSNTGIDLTPVYLRSDRNWTTALATYSTTLRDLMLSYGTSADLPGLLSLPNRITFPPYAEPDEGTAAWTRDYLWKMLEPTIDSIRARSGQE
jgi:hypothetical protein